MGRARENVAPDPELPLWSTLAPADATPEPIVPPSEAPGLLSGLNKAQRLGVVHEGPPLIVLAGPGTGKTRVITHRVAHLVLERGVDPASIVAVTFTNKAAEELRERLAALIGPGVADSVHAHTFHGFGLRLLRRFPDLSGLGSRPEIIDSAQRRRLLRALVAEHGVFGALLVHGAEALVGEAASYIGLFRNNALSPAQCGAFAAAWDEHLRRGFGSDGRNADEEALAAQRQEQERFAAHARLYGLFEAACRERGWVTIDELITAPAALLREHERVRAICRHEYRHFVVDEFQDVNLAQIELLRQLAPPESRPDLVVVGDDDQAIYEFRGADDRAFARFASIWRDAETLELTENYRSQQPVLDAANAVIARANQRFAPDKEIRRAESLRVGPVLPGAGVAVVQLADEPLAGDAIAALIREEAGRAPQAPLSRLAVIARTHTELDRVSAALELEGIPGQRREARRVLDDAGVQDLLAWAHLLVDPGATWAVRRVLWRPPIGVGAEQIAEWERAFHTQRRVARLEGGDEPDDYCAWLGRHALEHAAVSGFLALRAELRDLAQHASASDVIWAIATRADPAHADLPGGRERATRIENLVRVVRFVRAVQHRLDPPGDLAAFWSYYNDLDEKEQGFGDLGERWVERDEDEGPVLDAVQLLTAHGAKGLEFDVVFVPRVSPPHGFPNTAGSERLRLPEGLIDRLGDDRSPKERERAEERRIFYVACTRAERRLVLLTKATKSRSKSEHYAQELALDTPALVSVLDGDAVLAEGARDALSREASPADVRRLRRDLAMAERRGARAEAAAALDALERCAGGEEGVREAAARLREAAERLAVACAFGRDGTAPAWARSGAAGEAAARLAAGAERAADAAPGLVLRPMRPPLTLSFTQLDLFKRCAACFYVREVLGLDEQTTPAVSLGGLVHQVLEEHARQWRDAEADGRPTPGAESLLAAGRRMLLAQLRSGGAGDGLTAEELDAVLARAHAMMVENAAEILEVERRITMPYVVDGVEHRLIARLDRIDRTPQGVRIVDYKTGAPSKSRLEPPAADLQLGIYAMAIRHEMPEVRGTAEYWVLRTGQRGVIDLDRLDLARVREQIDGAARAMVAGEFARGKSCSGLCEILGEC